MWNFPPMNRAIELYEHVWDEVKGLSDIPSLHICKLSVMNLHQCRFIKDFRWIPSYKDPCIPLLDEQHLLIGRQRPEFVGHHAFQLVRHFAHSGHRGNDVIARIFGMIQR